jgi:hypothetical protein
MVHLPRPQAKSPPSSCSLVGLRGALSGTVIALAIIMRLATPLLFVFVAAPAWASTFYADAAAPDDNRSCAEAQNIGTPKKTIGAAVSCVQQAAASQPGVPHTVLVRKGTYRRFDIRNVNGTSSAWVTVKSYPGERAKIDPGQIVFYNSRYVELADFELTNSAFLTLGNSQGKYFNECGVFDDACQKAAPKPCDMTQVGCIDPDSTGHSWWIDTRNGYPAQVEIAGGYCASSSDPCGMSDHLIIRDLEIHHAAGGGITGVGKYIQILNNHIHHFGIRGFGMAYPMYISLDNSVVRGNICHDTSGTDGMRFAAYAWGPGYPDTGDNNIFEANVAYANGGLAWYAGTPRDGGSGITFYSDTGTIGNNIVRNNVFYGNRGSGIANSKGSTTNYIYNNTVYGNGNGGIANIGNSSVIRNNIAFGNQAKYNTPDFIQYGTFTGSQSNNLYGIDPLFVDAAAHDFRLRAGSPAIDAAMRVAEVTTDFSGATRPLNEPPDIGAFEYGAGAVDQKPAVPTALIVE